jgi:hypothetical protein
MVNNTNDQRTYQIQYYHQRHQNQNMTDFYKYRQNIQTQ